MIDQVIIKSHKDGIRLILSEEVEFPVLLEQIEARFKEGRRFFGNSYMVLSIEGRTLSDEEEKQVVFAIQENSDLKILCIVGKDDETEKNFVHILQTLEDRFKEHDYFKLYRGSLINNQSFQTEESLIVLGDVNPGCLVEAGRSIIVLGGLYGKAVCGKQNDNKESQDTLPNLDATNTDKHFIIALEMAPQELILNGVPYIPQEKSKWGIKQKINPKCAYLSGNSIKIENLSKAVLEKLYAL